MRGSSRYASVPQLCAGLLSATAGLKAGRGGLRKGAGVGGLLEEDADVLRQEHVLIEDQLPMRDLPSAVDGSQEVLARAEVEVLLRLRSCPIDEKVGVDPKLGGGVAGLHLD